MLLCISISGSTISSPSRGVPPRVKACLLLLHHGTQADTWLKEGLCKALFVPARYKEASHVCFPVPLTQRQTVSGDLQTLRLQPVSW